jgi:hypothetical protein
MPNLKLKDFEGTPVTLIFLNPAHPDGLQRERVMLLTVEDTGIWIENQKWTNDAFEKMNVPATGRRATFFYPYAAIHAIFVTVPGTSLPEKAFGA